MEEFNFDIVGVGAYGLDHHFLVTDLPEKNNKVLATATWTSEGGVTANNLAQAARLDAKVAWIGALGNDPIASKLIEANEALAIASYPAVYDGSSQQFWITHDQEGNTTMVGAPGATTRFKKDGITSDQLAIIAHARHVHTEIAVTPLEVVSYVTSLAKQSNCKLLLDVDSLPKNQQIDTLTLEIISQADVAKFSKETFLTYSDLSSIDIQAATALCKKGPELVVVTLGKDGALFVTRDKVIQHPGYKVSEVDSSGTGDAFMGGLSYGLLQGWSLEKVAAFANACGAIKVTKQGTRTQGNLQDVLNLMEGEASNVF